METVNKTVQNGLCISCGICAGNCPKHCITFKMSNKQFYPEIDSARCIECGICDKVCPTNQLTEYDGKQGISQYLVGDYRRIICVQAKSHEILYNSTSGGFITQVVKTLLEMDIYESAFLIEDYSCSQWLKAKRFISNAQFANTSKSRYLLVSHEETIKYMIAHPREKVILVGTGCAVQGIINTIKLHHFNRENYLILGLFCDKTMNHGVVEYFETHPCGKEKRLKNLFFRTKATGDWPGNVRLEYTDGSYVDLPNTERMKVKEYFTPERCLYCLDKLNRNSDIAVGDNYIATNRDDKGSNSCIIRTEVGMKCWKLCEHDFFYHKDDESALVASQHLDQKEKNYRFARIKGLYPDKKLRAERKYKIALHKRNVGLKHDVYKKVNADIMVFNVLYRLKSVFRG